MVGALVVLAASLIASFPYNVTVSRMLAPYQLRLVYQNQRLNLPIGVRLEHVSLLSTTDATGRPLIESSSVSLEPAFSSLFSGHTGLYLSAQIFGGTLVARLAQASNTVEVKFQAQDISLPAAGQLVPAGVALNGTLSGDGFAKIHGSSLLDEGGQVSLAGKGVTLRVMEGFPMIDLGDVNGRVALQNGVLIFDDVETHGGDVDSRVDGIIRLAPDPALSTIDARVALTPTQAGHDHFGLFFHMLPHPPEQGPYYVRGSLRDPSIT